MHLIVFAHNIGLQANQLELVTADEGADLHSIGLDRGRLQVQDPAGSVSIQGRSGATHHVDRCQLRQVDDPQL